MWSKPAYAGDVISTTPALRNPSRWPGPSNDKSQELQGPDGHIWTLLFIVPHMEASSHTLKMLHESAEPKFNEKLN